MGLTIELQRYDVIITANQTAGNYWFRTEVAKECRNANLNHGRAIWSYTNAEVGIPNSTALVEPTDCLEPGPLTPFWNASVPEGQFQGHLDHTEVYLSQSVVVPGGDNIVVWALGTNIDVDYSHPTLSYVSNGNMSFPEHFNVLPTSDEGGWNHLLIQQSPTMPPIPHPIHLHGHDFYVLGHGNTTYKNSTELNFETPTRRDTSTLYGGGWLALAFRSNNPGVWLMHCTLCCGVPPPHDSSWLMKPRSHRVARRRGFWNAIPRITLSNRSARHVQVSIRM